MTYASVAGGSYFQPGWYIRSRLQRNQDGHLLWGPLTEPKPKTRESNIASEAGMKAFGWNLDRICTSNNGYELSTGSKLWGPVCTTKCTTIFLDLA